MSKTHVKGEPPVAVAADENLTTVLWERADSGSSKVILRYPEMSGGTVAWRGLTWVQLAERVTRVAGGLLALGVNPGDRVAIMAGTSVEWTILDLAVLSCGAAVVPIYETDSPEQCEWMLTDAHVTLAVAGTAAHAKNLELARSAAPDLREVFVLEDGGLDAIVERGTDAERARVREVAGAVKAADLATLIYTSGTTGQPKGCVLAHSNWLWVAKQGGVTLKQMVGGDDSTLLFLPLAHSFARMVQFLCLQADVQIGYARSIDTLGEDLASFQPTFLLAVPRVFEKVFNAAQKKATGAKAKVFAFAVSAGNEWSGTDQPSLLTKVKHAIADKLVYSKLRHALGGRVRYAVSGGAPLAPHLAAFFHAAGMTILEGYGLTETSAPATVNRPDKMRIGTVGLPLAGIEIRIADDGEILIKGGNVFGGYLNNDEATREVLAGDGWFHSGDIGVIDDDGFLKITGRKKELIVTAGGKNVAPAVLEERIKQHRLVSQAMVVGDNKPFVGALITLDPEELAAFAKERGLSGSPAELVKSDASRPRSPRPSTTPTARSAARSRSASGRSSTATSPWRTRRSPRR